MLHGNDDRHIDWIAWGPLHSRFHEPFRFECDKAGSFAQEIYNASKIMDDL
jgi:hypothetical protein